MKLKLHGSDITSYFDLLGHDENGLTYGFGLMLSENKELLGIIVDRISGKHYQCSDYTVNLQRYGKKDRGFTDIELLVDNALFVIIEAKIGWSLPGQEQLNRYSRRFNEMKPYKRELVVISECRKEYAEQKLAELGLRVPIQYISWQEIFSFIRSASRNSSNYQKKMLNHLETYFADVISMQDKSSNKVLCVALSSEKPKGWKLSYIDIVEKRQKYFYPVQKGWPSDPPNYIAFRYYGKLQSVHHVDDYQVVTRMHEHLPVDREEWRPFFLLELGEPFKPAEEVPNGKIYPSQHLWFDLDTVFTCKTIREARDLSQKREESI